ncbi:MAG TPA: ABC transporter ATP-binding protein [Candidatus Binatia bacterium]|nr:ABC transporter ATP-binding protein [Candidatus Binatia bacterium]
MIRAQRLTKDYGRHRAVDDVSFHIEKGDIVGLLGPNGSGKTTIMRMLTGFFAPTDGDCSIAGIDIQRDPREARRHIGYLPERVALYPDLTVRRYLGFVARIHDVRGSVRGLVDEAMEQCGLAHMAKRAIGKLSRGYRQRVGIAQAIIHKPDVLVLDEPTVGLDPRQIVEIRSLIRSLAGRTTVLLSTHILPEVSITCRRVLILDHGRLVAEDTAEGLARKTTGRGETVLKVAAPERELERALAMVPGVAAVQVVAREPGGVITVAVGGAADAEMRPRLAEAVAAREWRLYEMAPRLISLEDLFVQILEEAEAKKP